MPLKEKKLTYVPYTPSARLVSLPSAGGDTAILVIKRSLNAYFHITA